MTNKPKVNLAFVETLPESPVKGTVYMSPDSAEGFLKVGVGDNETETIFDSSVYAKKSDSVWVAGEGVNSAVLKDSSSRAIGTGAVAHGSNATAAGNYSHAEGLRTIVSGEHSHAEGYVTVASGSISHAEGYQTRSSGQGSHAEGHGNIKSLSFTISGDANATTYTTNANHGLKKYDVIEYNGVIAMVTAYISSRSFSVDHTLSDEQLTNASGLKKINGISYGASSHAEGFQTGSLGQWSHAEGSDTIAFGNYSHSEGYKTTVSGNYSHAEGYNTTVSGTGSHVEGTGTKASGDYSHAEGSYTKAYGSASHAEGYYTTASGDYSHAEGRDTTASGNYSHAEGYNTIASGNYSHAEGRDTTASGNYSHAEGYNTTVSGTGSHVEGTGTKASGDYSHAEGYLTRTANAYEHAQGILNISRENSLFSIGNGYENSNPGPDEDSILYRNALEIMRNGNAYLYGVASFDGQTISNKKTLQYFLNIDPISNNEYDIIFGNNSEDVPADFDTIIRLHLYIDDYPSYKISDMMEEVGAETVEEFYDIVYDANVNGNSQYPGDAVYANEYVYEDTVVIDGTSYYLWHDSNADMYAIMRMDMTMDYLDSIAKCNNPDSNVSPFVAIVTEDSVVRYDDTTSHNVNDGFQLACYKIDED